MEQAGIEFGRFASRIVTRILPNFLPHRTGHVSFACFLAVHGEICGGVHRPHLSGADHPSPVQPAQSANRSSPDRD